MNQLCFTMGHRFTRQLLGRSSSKPCACQIGFLIAVLRLADRRLGLLHFAASKGSPEKSSNGTVTPEWAQSRSMVQWLEAGALWACACFEEHTQNPNIMTCYAGGEECAQPTAFAQASPWISYPARRAPWCQARRSAT